jgi:hypothetical protein
MNTINGLQDGISVVENDNKNQQLSYQSDILYNDSYCEEEITLLSTITMEEAILGKSVDTIET